MNKFEYKVPEECVTGSIIWTLNNFMDVTFRPEDQITSSNFEVDQHMWNFQLRLGVYVINGQ